MFRPVPGANLEPWETSENNFFAELDVLQGSKYDSKYH